MSKGLDPRGYVRIYPGKAHPFANSGGWAWRHRLAAMEQLGRRLAPHEHVHHAKIRRGEAGADEWPNLEVLLATDHGREHALEMERDARGKFRRRKRERVAA